MTGFRLRRRRKFCSGTPGAQVSLPGRMKAARLGNALALSFALTQAPVFAAQQHPAVVVADAEDQEEDFESATSAHDRGVISGDIVSIDYARGIVEIQTARRGRVVVQMLPSTAVLRHGDQYGSIGDLAHGVRVSVNVSEVDGRLVAEMIRIR